MKHLVILAAVLALNSCNTTIGLYRDTKAVVLWTKGKIQGDGGGSGGGGGAIDGGADPVDYEYGAPIY